MYAARGDVSNDPMMNGERTTQTIALSTSVSPATVFDIGANVGDWTASLLEASRKLRVSASVHELSPARKRLKCFPSASQILRTSLCQQSLLSARRYRNHACVWGRSWNEQPGGASG